MNKKITLPRPTYIKTVARVFATWKIRHIEDSPHGRFATHSTRYFNEKLPAL